MIKVHVLYDFCCLSAWQSELALRSLLREETPSTDPCKFQPLKTALDLSNGKEIETASLMDMGNVMYLTQIKSESLKMISRDSCISYKPTRNRFEDCLTAK